MRSTRVWYSGMLFHTWKSPRSSGIQRQRSMLTIRRCASEPNAGRGALPAAPLRAVRVCLLSTPSARRPFFFWKAFTASATSSSNIASVPGEVRTFRRWRSSATCAWSMPALSVGPSGSRTTASAFSSGWPAPVRALTRACRRRSNCDMLGVLAAQVVARSIGCAHGLEHDLGVAQGRLLVDVAADVGRIEPSAAGEAGILEDGEAELDLGIGKRCLRLVAELRQLEGARVEPPVVGLGDLGHGVLGARREAVGRHPHERGALGIERGDGGAVGADRLAARLRGELAGLHHQRIERRRGRRCGSGFPLRAVGQAALPACPGLPAAPSSPLPATGPGVRSARASAAAKLAQGAGRKRRCIENLS